MPDSEKKDSRRKTEAVAVALSYQGDIDSAPKVVAGGRGSIAEQILQIAFANDVKVREDADLAELLSAIDIDSEIPVEAFAAVAEILNYVYRANGGAHGASGTVSRGFFQSGVNEDGGSAS
ncbi:MAG: EscU/YscU/HrcU family type III secretion system export apparatus switch protein [Rhodospirillales bacterium]|nr:EscU/YscU/HrcU family type III secretion system export apparatus switch protein [Rhodospirillales bacterium]